MVLSLGLVGIPSSSTQPESVESPNDIRRLVAYLCGLLLASTEISGTTRCAGPIQLDAASSARERWCPSGMTTVRDPQLMVTAFFRAVTEISPFDRVTSNSVKAVDVGLIRKCRASTDSIPCAGELIVSSGAETGFNSLPIFIEMVPVSSASQLLSIRTTESGGINAIVCTNCKLADPRSLVRMTSPTDTGLRVSRSVPFK
jgi:hypothetical protein